MRVREEREGEGVVCVALGRDVHSCPQVDDRSDQLHNQGSYLQSNSRGSLLPVKRGKVVCHISQLLNDQQP